MKNKNFKTQRDMLTRLLNEWDPIGVLPFKGGPKDEYECFILPILKVLKDNKNEAKIRGVLMKHIEEHCGLKYYPSEKVDRFVAQVLDWWKHFF